VLLRAPEPAEVEITGGTHVSFAPIWEFFAESYLPQLRAMGAEVEAERTAYGFYPAGRGGIRLRTQPLHAECPRPFALTDRGALLRARVSAIVSGIPLSIAESEADILQGKFPGLTLERDVREVPSPGPGNAVWVTLEYERVTAVFSEVGSYDLSRKVVAHRVMNAVRKYLKTDAPVGPHLADQLAVPIIALTGAGTFVKGKDTLHETTNWETIRAFLPEAAIERTECEGTPTIRLRIRR
jgi:RNA 3'-terminal phosphate cyclase (ATP)